MQVEIPVEMLIQTILTGIIGWAVKTILDQLKAYREESKEWRSDIESKIDNISDGTQATMRTTILHYCEKYISRDWVISEELNSLLDMHDKYCKLNDNNGLINSYVERVKQLEVREI